LGAGIRAHTHTHGNTLLLLVALLVVVTFQGVYPMHVSPIHGPTRAVGPQDKPYALFGACLGAIVAYELVCAVEAGALAPPPIALFVAAVSPPDLYARAVMKLYLTRPLGDGEPSPRTEVLAKLAGWEALPRETLMLVRRPSAQSQRISVCL